MVDHGWLRAGLWYLPPVTPTLVAVDFDGTITTRDTLHVIVEQFGAAGVWDRLEPRLRSGEISIEDAMSEQFAAVDATRDEVLPAIFEHSQIRDGFAEFIAWTASHHMPVVVISAGFRDVIDAMLQHAGIEGLMIHSNDIRFSRDGARLIFAERGAPCGICGRRCKRHVLGTVRDTDQPLVYVGDGISDRCASRMADLIFARASLAEDLAAEGHPFLAYESFYDVIRGIEASPEVAL